MKRSLRVLLVSLFAVSAGFGQPTLRLTLRETAALAAGNNPLVLGAHHDVEAAEKQHSRAWREYAPTITANAQYQYLNDDLALKVDPITLPFFGQPVSIAVPPIPLLDRSTLRADITATMPLFTGLRIESGIRATRHMVEDATAQDTLTLQKQVTEALLDYHQVLLAQQNLAARTEALSTAKHHADDVRLILEQGVATQYDRIRSDLAVADAERAMTEAENGAMLAEKALKKELCLPDSIRLELADSLTFSERTVDLAQALAAAEASRPELHSLAEKKETVKALSAVETGKMLPQIGAFAKYELNKKALTQLDPAWVVGLSANITIFNGLKDLAAGQVYDLQGEKIDDLRHEVVDAIALEVRKYYADMQTAKRTVATTQTALDLAREALRMAARRFETGTGTSLEVIDAQTSVVAMRTAHAAALHAYRSSYIQLVRSMGNTDLLLTGVF